MILVLGNTKAVRRNCKFTTWPLILTLSFS